MAEKKPITIRLDAEAYATLVSTTPPGNSPTGYATQLLEAALGQGEAGGFNLAEDIEDIRIQQALYGNEALARLDAILSNQVKGFGAILLNLAHGSEAEVREWVQANLAHFQQPAEPAEEGA